MTVDFTVKDFEFFVGGRRLTRNVVQLVLQRPKTDRGRPKAWTGTFRVSACQGEDPYLFYEFTDPLWFPYQREVTLRIGGWRIFTGWIEQYRYDPLRNEGVGRLVDAIAFADFGRVVGEPSPEGLSPGEAYSPLSPNWNPVKQEPYPIRSLVDDLVAVASEGRPWSFSSVGDEVKGQIKNRFESDNPLRDAQTLAERDFYWLYVDAFGDLAWQRHPLAGGKKVPFVVSRALCDVVIEPSTEVPPFVYDEVLVTGQRDEAFPVEKIGDEKGRPKQIVTETKLSTGDIVGDFRRGAEYRAGVRAPETVLSSYTIIDFEYDDSPAGGGRQSKKTTRIRQPLGWWFKDFRGGPDAPAGPYDPYETMLETVEIETDDRIVQEIPAAIIAGDARPQVLASGGAALSPTRLGGLQFNTIIRREQIVENAVDVVPQLQQSQLGAIGVGEIEVEGQKFRVPNLPPRPVAPDFQVVNTYIEGKVKAILPGGVTAFNRVLTISYDRLESENQAGEIADFWAKYEYGRQYGWVVEMEVPPQWLANPLPFFLVVVEGIPMWTDDLEIEIGVGAMVFRVTGIPASPFAIPDVPAPPAGQPAPVVGPPFLSVSPPGGGPIPNTTLLNPMSGWVELQAVGIARSQAQCGLRQDIPIEAIAVMESQSFGSVNELFGTLVQSSQASAELVFVSVDQSQSLVKAIYQGLTVEDDAADESQSLFQIE